MAKKKSKSKGKSMAKEFPSPGNPMDAADHPVNSIPTPSGGAFNAAQMMSPGAPMLPGEPM